MNKLSIRKTKYSTAVMRAIKARGHITNSELLTTICAELPSASATTIHRSTARLCERGEIIQAPPSIDGSMRYDANTIPHDHFICINCGGIRDLDIAESILPLLTTVLGGCKVTGRLTIHGSCENCIKKGQE